MAFLTSLFADFVGGLFVMVVDRCFGVFFGDRFDDGKGVLVGELFFPLQSGDRLTLSMLVRVTVQHLVLVLIGSVQRIQCGLILVLLVFFPCLIL